MVSTTLRSMFPQHTFVGFDQLIEDLELFAPTTTSYPPHNVTQDGDDSYSIELAVAGFSEDEIEVRLEKRTLIITSNKNVNKDVPEYIHKGISTKNFTRTFKLAENVEVKDVYMLNGMLKVSLQLVVPEEDKPVKLTINKGPQLLNE